MKQLKFFLDFDGTVSSGDVVDLVLDRFASAEWRDVEKEWAAGKIGSRECLSRQFALVKAAQKELEALISGIKVDPGFNAFLAAAAELSVPVTVVSDGFDFFIERILANNIGDPLLLKNLAVFSNRLALKEGSFTASFASNGECGHNCGNCKPAVLKRLAGKNDFVIFVGDGLSDRFAAEVSDLTFAKGKLLDFCKTNRLKHRPFDNFHEIEKWLRQCAAGQRAMKALRHV